MKQVIGRCLLFPVALLAMVLLVIYGVLFGIVARLGRAFDIKGAP